MIDDGDATANPFQRARNYAGLLNAFTDCKRAYQLAFGGVAGRAVLADLVPFCRGKETCAVRGDPYGTYILEGRREVYLRIMDYLELTPEELVKKYTREVQGVSNED